jgi:hypothetical protein
MNDTLRIWVYRILVLVAAALMALSWNMSWWNADAFNVWVGSFPAAVQIYPYGLQTGNLGDFASYIENANLPGWFGPVMWVYLGICILALLYGIFMKEKNFKIGRMNLSLPRFIIGIVGISYCIVAIVAVIFASYKLRSLFDANLLGYSYVRIAGEDNELYGSLQLGYWLAWAAGIVIIILALLRNKITGK